MRENEAPSIFFNKIVEFFSHPWYYFFMGGDWVLELYKNIKMNKYDELSVLDLFAYHIENVTGSFLKSYKLFKELIITI